MFVAIFDIEGNERDFEIGSLAFATAKKLFQLEEVNQAVVYEKVLDEYGYEVVKTLWDSGQKQDEIWVGR